MCVWGLRRGGFVPTGIACQMRVKDREFVIDNLLVRIHVIIVMIRWTGLAPWESEFSFSGVLGMQAGTLLQRESSALTTYWSESTLST